mmetsp:Transcript_50451/g.168524  ORF Transcript_50451/g.168524 Transcript_50451/m.168524 type:complete len:269 (-) Transcript_50451:356-1162(-)
MSSGIGPKSSGPSPPPPAGPSPAFELEGGSTPKRAARAASACCLRLPLASISSKLLARAISSPTPPSASTPSSSASLAATAASTARSSSSRCAAARAARRAPASRSRSACSATRPAAASAASAAARRSRSRDLSASSLARCSACSAFAARLAFSSSAAAAARAFSSALRAASNASFSCFCRRSSASRCDSFSRMLITLFATFLAAASRRCCSLTSGRGLREHSHAQNPTRSRASSCCKRESTLGGCGSPTAESNSSSSVGASRGAFLR